MVHRLETAGPLTVDFCGEVHVIEDANTLTFGRTAQLHIDDNPFMHRVVGRFEARHGRWWVANLGSSITIEIFDRQTRSKAIVAPQNDQALPGEDLVVRFAAGPTTYEIDARCKISRNANPKARPSGPETRKSAPVPMTTSQLQLILALAEPSLRAPQEPIRIPPTKQAIQRLNWGTSQFNRKLDNVCDKLTRAGVTGLKATPSDRAVDRRRRLVQHAISTGLVTEDMLRLLDQDD